MCRKCPDCGSECGCTPRDRVRRVPADLCGECGMPAQDCNCLGVSIGRELGGWLPELLDDDDFERYWLAREKDVYRH